MTQDNLIARIEDAELALAHWDEGRNSEYWLRHPVPIERLSPPLNGEGVIQAATFLCERLREHENCDEAGREFHGHVVPALARMESALSLQDKT